jgi:hypothetical protein
LGAFIGCALAEARPACDACDVPPLTPRAAAQTLNVRSVGRRRGSCEWRPLLLC